MNFKKLHISEVGRYCPNTRKLFIYPPFELDKSSWSITNAPFQHNPLQCPPHIVIYGVLQHPKQRCPTSNIRIKNP